MNTSPSRNASMPRSRIVASMGKPRCPWNTGSPTPWAIIRTSASKIAQPKSRLSLMMWLYAVLIIVIRMRSAAALSAARITSTVMGSTRTSVAAMLIALLLSSSELDHQASVLLDCQDVARLHERGRPGLLDGRRALDDVSRAQVAALDDTVCDEGSARWRVDPSRLENRRLPGVAELRQPASLDGHHESQPKIDQLHRDVGRGVAIHAFMRGVELAAKLIPHPRIRQLHRHRMDLTEVAHVHGAPDHREAHLRQPRDHLGGHVFELSRGPGRVGTREGLEDGADEVMAEVGRKHAPGRECGRCRRDHHRRDA